MRAAVLTAPEHIVFDEIDMPEPGAGQVRVRVMVVTICGSDHHIWLGEFGNRIPYPHVMGHEFAGVIDKCGAGVKNFEVGTRVTVDPLVHCGTCTACRQGETSACESLKLLGVDMNGGMAEYIICSAQAVYRLPDDVPMRHGGMVEVYSVACHSLRRGGIEPADTVAVFGSGKLGLCILDVLMTTGARTVFAVDVDELRLKIAEAFGATPVNATQCDPVDAILSETDGRGVDVAVEAVGHAREIPGRPAPLDQAGAVIRNAGRVIILGQGAEPVPLHVRSLVWKEATLIMSRVTRGEFPRAIALLEDGVLHPDRIVTHRAPMGEAADMFRRINAAEAGMVKVQLEHEGYSETC